MEIPVLNEVTYDTETGEYGITINDTHTYSFKDRKAFQRFTKRVFPKGHRLHYLSNRRGTD